MQHQQNMSGMIEQVDNARKIVKTGCHIVHQGFTFQQGGIDWHENCGQQS